LVQCAHLEIFITKRQQEANKKLQLEGRRTQPGAGTGPVEAGAFKKKISSLSQNSGVAALVLGGFPEKPKTEIPPSTHTLFALSLLSSPISASQVALIGHGKT
jgi:hypothetical protein